MNEKQYKNVESEKEDNIISNLQINNKSMHNKQYELEKKQLIEISE